MHVITFILGWVISSTHPIMYLAIRLLELKGFTTNEVGTWLVDEYDMVEALEDD